MRGAPLAIGALSFSLGSGRAGSDLAQGARLCHKGTLKAGEGKSGQVQDETAHSLRRTTDRGDTP
jgi:hypothetical protein